MFLYALKQKVLLDVLQIAEICLHKGWQKINTKNIPFESPYFSIVLGTYFM